MLAKKSCIVVFASRKAQITCIVHSSASKQAKKFEYISCTLCVLASKVKISCIVGVVNLIAIGIVVVGALLALSSLPLSSVSALLSSLFFLVSLWFFVSALFGRDTACNVSSCCPPKKRVLFTASLSAGKDTMYYVMCWFVEKDRMQLHVLFVACRQYCVCFLCSSEEGAVFREQT